MPVLSRSFDGARDSREKGRRNTLPRKHLCTGNLQGRRVGRGPAREAAPPREGKPRAPGRTRPPPPSIRASPSTPTLRANPYPEVTDPICRLPLPTLFYRPEAVHLGDLLRIWVRAGASPPSPPRDFQGPASCSWMLRELQHSSPKPKPILRARRFKGLGGLCRKDNSSQSSGRRLPVASRCHDRYEGPKRFRYQVPEYGPDSLSASPWLIQ